MFAFEFYFKVNWFDKVDMNILLFLKLYLRVFGIPEEQTLSPLFMEVFVIPYMLVLLYQASSSQSRAPALQTSSDISGRTKRKAEENGKFSKKEKRLIIYLFIWLCWVFVAVRSFL